MARVAAAALRAPVALVSLVGVERQFFKSCIGLQEPWASRRETPISHSFCQHAVLSGEPVVIADSREDPLFRDSPAIEALHVVAYAGVPLVTSNGDVIGTFCVIDAEPRRWTERDVAMLRDLAATAMVEIERRMARDAVRAAGAGAAADERAGDVRGRHGGLNIAALARRTGVAPDTLRKWEQRYGILHPTRTPGGQRRYGAADVARVEWLNARLAEGYRTGEAAALLGRRGPVAKTTDELREHLLAAAGAVDCEAVERLLDQAFALPELERTLATVIAPALEEVGRGWESGRFTVAQEHLVSESVRARLERLLADARGGVRGRAVLACGPGERHELGVLMLAVLLRADGWQVAYLGADTPLPDALSLAAQSGARLCCLSVARAETLAELTEAAARVPVPRGVAVVLGGAAASADAARELGARYLDGDLQRTVRALRRHGR